MRLEIHGEIDEGTLEDIVNKVYIEYLVGEDVIIDFDSPGGFIEVAEEITNVLASLRDAGSKIICVNSGNVMSSATVIWLMGDERIWDSRYRFLVHEPYVVGVSGDGEDLLETSIQLFEIQEELAHIYSMFSEERVSKLKEVMKENRALSMSELESFGFITALK